jgi:hypothetical protein
MPARGPARSCRQAGLVSDAGAAAHQPQLSVWILKEGPQAGGCAPRAGPVRWCAEFVSGADAAVVDPCRPAVLVAHLRTTARDVLARAAAVMVPAAGDGRPLRLLNSAC